jgi:hypothetical protein
MAKSGSRSSGGRGSSRSGSASTRSAGKSRGSSGGSKGGKWVSASTKKTLKEIGMNAAAAVAQTVAGKATRAATIQVGESQQAGQKRGGSTSRSRAASGRGSRRSSK